MKKEIRYLIRTIVGAICIFIIGLVIIVTTENPKEYELNTSTKTTLQEITKETTIQETTAEESTVEESTSKETIVETTTSIETTKPKIVKTTQLNIAKTTETVEKTKTTTDISKHISLGEFKLTAYCNCSKCCGKWAGSPTASGVMPKANRTIAVDTSVIPFGTEVIINGNTYVAEDTGSAIRGNKIDIYMSSHEEALDFGVQYAEVFIVNE